MLKPSMQELMKRVGNRYLLVNLAAQRARDIADQAEESGEQLSDKAVKLALDEIAAGEVVYRPGPRVAPVIAQNNAIAAAMVDVDDAIDLDADEQPQDMTRRRRKHIASTSLMTTSWMTAMCRRRTAEPWGWQERPSFYV